MLHNSKSQSIVQWFNSMVTKGAIQSLAQLSDGVQFYDVVTTINNLKKGKISDAPSSCDNLVNDSNTSVTSTTQAGTNDESNAEANSSATEMDVDDDAPEKHKETETKVHERDAVGNSKKVKNDAEVEKRFNAIKKFIDEFSDLDSSSLITYADCIKGKELELAKVAVLLLSAMVQCFISTSNDQLYTTTLLDIQVQEDIKECLSLVLETNVEDGPLKKSELHRILSRPSKSKGTPRRRTPSRGTSEVAETPETSKMPKKRRDRASIVAEEIFESPLKSLLESPKIQFKAAMFKKDAELYKLKEDLDNEETKVIDLTLEKRSLNDELEKKKRELKFLKEEHRKLQECVDEADSLKMTKMEEMNAEKERDKKIIQNLKEDLECLKKENENLLTEIAHLQEKLTQKSNTEGADYRKLHSEVVELQLNVNIKEDKIKDLKCEVSQKDKELNKYKQMCEDLKTSGKSVSITSPKIFENVGNIIYADERTAREMLAEKEIECDNLKKQLSEEQEKSRRFQCILDFFPTLDSQSLYKKFLKKAENDHSLLLSNVRSLQNKLADLQGELESPQKQAKSKNEETAAGNPPESLSSSLWPSTFDGLERNVKEELESVKADSDWDAFSVKSMETRSRSASALGYHRDIYADSTNFCSDADFASLKKVACAIGKILTKMCPPHESQYFTQMNKVYDQAKRLGSVKDLSEFFKAVVEALKSLKPTKCSATEIQTRQKCRSQTLGKTENTTLENKTELDRLKHNMNRVQEEFKNQLEVKTREAKIAEEKCKKLEARIKELETDMKELNDKMEKSQQETTDANKKYEFAKKHIEKINQENRKLLKVCMLLKDDAGPKVEPCKDCEFLREKLSDVKQDRNEFEKDSFELKAIVRDLESKNNNLERQLKNEIKERKKLEFQIQRESAFLSGSMSERNAVVRRYFQQGLAESKRAKIQAENERKSMVEDKGPQQVMSFNTYIFNHENRYSCPENSASVSAYANRSIRSDDEEDFLNHSSLAQIQRDVFPEPDADNRRLTEIQRRNTLCLPHLQSSYPLELQNMTPTERKYFEKLRAPVQSYRRPLESATEETHAEFIVDSDDSQDAQHLRKRKGPEVQKSVQPIKKTMRSSSQARLVQRVKPITPVRKTGFISKTKSFKTPTSIRRLMRISQKNKKP